jgi:hypothetical protein
MLSYACVRSTVHEIMTTDLRKWCQLAQATVMACTTITRDGNGYPSPVAWWVFTLLGCGFGPLSLPMGLLTVFLWPIGYDGYDAVLLSAPGSCWSRLSLTSSVRLVLLSFGAFLFQQLLRLLLCRIFSACWAAFVVWGRFGVGLHRLSCVSLVCLSGF